MVDISGITEQVETLIDSGSTCNFINITFVRNNKISLIELPREKAVRGINGKDLPTSIWYKCLLQFKVEGREFRQKFYTMPLGESKVILGMEWLRKAEPIILWNPLEIRWEMEEGKMGTLPVEISDFKDVFSEEVFKELPPHRRYDCQINLKEDHPLPKPAKIYPMSPQESKACQEYIKVELADGKIQRSSSPIAAPAFFVPKADRSLQLVIDYRKLNEATISDQFPIPRQDDLIEKVKEAKIFMKLDLCWGYNNIHVREGDKWKTAFRTKEGLYEYKVMPFGLKNGPATFQRFMNKLFEDLLDIYVVVYLDNILIFSKTREEHTEHLREVLEQLRGAHLFCKETKCHFFVEEVVYIGIVISPEGVSMEKDKIRAIQEWSKPKTVKEVQSFLGFANFYRRFVNNFSLLVKPLTRLTQKEEKWKWEEEEETAFRKIKEAISQDPVLRHPDEKKPYFLETDASGVAMGAILSQRQEDGYLHPIAYLSQSFNDAQCNYDTHDKELCTIITALEGWQYLLEGTEEPITIYTDHRNLEYWANSSKFNRRHARWYQTLASFNFVIIYRPGKMSNKPDLLSRRSDHVERLPPEQVMIPQERFVGFKSDVEEDDLEDIAEHQGEDPSLEEIITMVKKKSKLPLSIQKGYKDYEWEEGLLYYHGKIVVPDEQELRNRLLWKHHDHPLAGHQGHARTLEGLGRRFWWANMKAEVGRYVDMCPTCQHMKGQKIKTPLKAMDIPMGPWEDITYDMIHRVSSGDGWAVGTSEPVAGGLPKKLLQLPTIRLDRMAPNGGIFFGKTMEWDVADKRTMNIWAEEWGKVISEAQAEAKAALQFNCQEGEVSREFFLGEKVLLLSTNIRGERESKKLDDKRMGPFIVKTRISSHVYELDLPGSMKIYPVFHVSLLTAWKEDEKFKQKHYAPRLIMTEEGKEVQVVDQILDWWVDKEDNNQLHYQVWWEGEGEEGDTWERAEKMAELKPIMKKFLKENPEAPRPAGWGKTIKKGRQATLTDILGYHTPQTTSTSLLSTNLHSNHQPKNVPTIQANLHPHLLGKLHAQPERGSFEPKGLAEGGEGATGGEVPSCSDKEGPGILWRPAGEPPAPPEDGVHGVGRSPKEVATGVWMEDLWKTEQCTLVGPWEGASTWETNGEGMRDWALGEGRWIDTWGTDPKWEEWEDLKGTTEWRMEQWREAVVTCPREEYLLRQEEDLQTKICKLDEDRYRVMGWKYREGDEVPWRDVGKEGWTLDDLVDYLQWWEWEEEDQEERDREEEEKREKHKLLMVMEWAGEQEMELRHSGSDDRTIWVWDTHNGTLTTGPFHSHTDWVTSVAFSPNGAHIVSGSHDQTIRVWNVCNGTLIAGLFHGHTDSVTSVAFSPDRARIVSGSHDQTIQVWSSNPHKPYNLVASQNNSLHNHVHVSVPQLEYWVLDSDGWFLNVNSELLFWVPTEIQPQFPRLSNALTIGPTGATYIECYLLYLGMEWHKCFTG
ncbi:Retrotransposable element Tf2 [Ceratobasidium theobromae]|uniref:Retrotransposable element Tf2 n=1 Tax=Ceratobasidium theobromae TaxID=1582974 RepID=A0A5N5QBG9_9AGAM|nr:Retrotransposable element Tf2 [Ceratobasidium theobromae]